MSRSSEKLILRSAVAGAVTGISAWLIYGVVELFFSVAFPILTSNTWELLAWQWRLIAILFAIYAAFGLLSGIVAGVWLANMRRKNGSRSDQTLLACAILAAVFALNLSLGWPLSRSENLALAAAVALAAGFVLVILSGKWQQRTAFLASPFFVSTFLLIGPWVSRRVLIEYSGLVKAVGSLLAMMAVAGLAVLRHKISNTASNRTVLAAAAGAILLVAAWPALRAGSATAPSAAGTAGGRPNILLITMDTVRADHVSMYGYERNTTPRLSEFARQATLYRNAIAASDFTLPTHGSIFTGLYPSWHRAMVSAEHPYGAPLRPRSRTMASMLRASGYWTAEAVANFAYVGPVSGLTQGFELTRATQPVHIADANRPFYLREGARKILSLFFNTDRFDEYRLRATDVNRQALEILDQAGRRRQPFFLFLNYMDAHLPYLPSGPFENLFSAGGSDVQPIAARDCLPIRDAVNAGKRALSDAEKRYLISQYDAGIASADAAIGDLLQGLRDRGLYDQTLIIVTADHGEAFGDHGYMEHAVGSLYQEHVHVPLLVKYPGQRSADSSGAVVSQVDFLPTVLETAGIPVPDDLQGRSFRSRGEHPDAVFAETSTRGDLRSMPRFRGSRRAVFEGNLELILWTDGKPELYDRATDRLESNNRYRPDDGRVAELAARANAWIAAMPRRDTAPHSLQPIDPRTLDKLRSLGYAR